MRASMHHNGAHHRFNFPNPEPPKAADPNRPFDLWTEAGRAEARALVERCKANGILPRETAPPATYRELHSAGKGRWTADGRRVAIRPNQTRCRRCNARENLGADGFCAECHRSNNEASRRFAEAGL